MVFLKKICDLTILGKRSKKINKKIKKALFSQTGPFSQTKNKLIKQKLWGINL